MRLRAMTYNVRSMRGGANQIAEVIVAQDPDVALIQECGPRTPLLHLAESVGMEAVSSHRPFGRVHNAVLYRAPLRAAWHEVHEFERAGRTSPRGFLAARLRWAEGEVLAVSTHLGLVPRERVAHARALTDLLAGQDAPAVIGADLNEDPSGPAAGWIAARLSDALAVAEQFDGPGRTFPARAPTVRIDYLFVRGLEVRRAWIPTGPVAARASDHRPVVGNLESVSTLS